MKIFILLAFELFLSFSVQVFAADDPDPRNNVPINSRMYIGTANGLELVDTRTFEIVGSPIMNHTPTSMAYNPLNQCIYAVNGDHDITLINQEHQMVKMFSFKLKLHNITYNPDDNHMYISTLWGRIKAIRMNVDPADDNYKTVKKWDSLSYRASCLAYNPDNKHMYSPNRNCVSMINTENGDDIKHQSMGVYLTGKKSPFCKWGGLTVHTLAYNTENQCMYVGGHQQTTVSLHINDMAYNNNQDCACILIMKSNPNAPSHPMVTPENTLLLHTRIKKIDFIEEGSPTCMAYNPFDQCVYVTFQYEKGITRINSNHEVEVREPVNLGTNVKSILFPTPERRFFQTKPERTANGPHP